MLHIRTSAQADVAETLVYYSAIAESLPEAFLAELNVALRLLCEHPHIGSRRFAHIFPRIDLRTWSLERFPFRVFYIVKGNTLHVLRVDHERRNVTSKMIDETEQ